MKTVKRPQNTIIEIVRQATWSGSAVNTKVMIDDVTVCNLANGEQTTVNLGSIQGDAELKIYTRIFHVREIQEVKRIEFKMGSKILCKIVYQNGQIEYLEDKADHPVEKIVIIVCIILLVAILLFPMSFTVRYY